MPLDFDVSMVGKLLLAIIVGAIVGANREKVGKPAGLRTHILVTLGATLLTLVAVEVHGISDASSRVVQGIATGIGFVGAGSIIVSRHQIHGLTTAASMWAVTAIGVAIGYGMTFLAAISSLMVIGVLTLLKTKDRKR